MYNLQTPISVLKGIGKVREQKLRQAGICTIGDLLSILPVRYEDRTKFSGFTLPLPPTPVSVCVRILKKGTVRRIRRNMSLFVLPVIWEGGEKPVKGEIIFFNQPYLVGNFKAEEEYLFYGKIQKKDGEWFRMYSPKFSPVSLKETFLQILPNYSSSLQVPEKTLLDLIRQCIGYLKSGGLDVCPVGNDYYPDWLKESYELTDYASMIENIHFPSSKEALETALKRLKFEEGFEISLGILSLKEQGYGANPITTDQRQLEEFLGNLPYRLTNAQMRVLNEILEDLRKTTAMNRMVQGDVGSGKTVLAIICCYLMALSGYQSAYMAPTEILAEQHYKNFKSLLEPFGIECALLTGSVKEDEAEKIRERIEDGKVQVIIGTHALIQEKTNYYNLGLVITDEQHRFGVKQRGLLTKKGSCHTLVMSATPIPRSLALSLYGDLELSVIDELPGGRKKIKTYFYTTKKLRKILDFARDEIRKGHQVYIVCPFIEESEEMPDVADVEKTFEKIKAYYKSSVRLDKLHSRMKSQEKEAIIRRFTLGESDLLLSTSMIEVGIDVKNATCMIVLSADRFGLAQLHQLRGRVGRSDLQSYCFLVSDNLSEISIERMKIIVNNDDGQKIAQADYALRGPGEYFGTRQSGHMGLKLLDPFEESELFESCVQAAKAVYSSGKKADMYLKDRILSAFKKKIEEISLT